MTGGPSTIRYLCEADVAACAPAPGAAVDLADRALRIVADGRAELPPKPAVHPRPGAFANAMPAYVADGDLLGLKWIAAFPGNRHRDLPTVTGLVVLSDADTGLPCAVLGAETLTGVRTAAVSGACLRALAPAAPGHLAITGAGLQARTHLRVAEALGRHDVHVYARSPARGEELAAWSAEHVPAVRLRIGSTVAEVVEGAAVVVTAVPIGAADAVVPRDRLRDDVLLLPLDYATSVTAEVAEGAWLVADDLGQFDRFRERGALPGYRRPDAATGAALDGPRPPGRVVVQNLGHGVVDLLFADAVVRAATTARLGTVLER